MKINKKIIILFLAVIFIFALYSSGMPNHFNLSSIQENAIPLKKAVKNNYIMSIIIYISVYVLLTLFMPTAAILTLLAGYLFGAILGGLITTIAASIGAIAGCWLSRFYIGNWVQNKWPNQLSRFNNHISSEGNIYLIFIRMLPFLSYSMVNYFLGLTRVSTFAVAWTTAVGSIPIIFIFTYAGRNLLTLESVNSIVTSNSFILLSILVLLGISFKIYLRIKNIKNQKLHKGG